MYASAERSHRNFSGKTKTTKKQGEPKSACCGSNSHPQQFDDTSSTEHKAIEIMRALFDSSVPDYGGSEEFLGICSRLHASPAFRAFAEEKKVDVYTAARLLVAGFFYAQTGGEDICYAAEEFADYHRCETQKFNP